MEKKVNPMEKMGRKWKTRGKMPSCLDMENQEKYTLYNVEVEKYKIDGATLIKISSDIPDIFEDVSSDNAKLMIYTTKYKLALQLGSITIIRPDEYELLGIDSLYGSL